MTARLLNRTKPSLRTFIAPQASFAINCWASLSKCHKLRVLDLSLVSECISYQSLNQTVRQLPELAELYLPRCSSHYEGMGLSMNVKWPPKLQHLSISGSVHGKFMWDMLRTPENFPRTLSSISISHCPGIDHVQIRSFLRNISSILTHLRLHDLPAVKQGRLDGVLDWAPSLKSLTIAVDYISVNFGHMPVGFNPSMWPQSKSLESLTLLSSGNSNEVDPNRSFAAVDLFTLIDERFLGCLRYLNIAASTGWANKDEAAEVDALELLLHELDRENWECRRWHYEQYLGQYEDMSWGVWLQTSNGKRMRPKLRLLRDQ